MFAHFQICTYFSLQCKKPTKWNIQQCRCITLWTLIYQYTLFKEVCYSSILKSNPSLSTKYIPLRRITKSLRLLFCCILMNMHHKIGHSIQLQVLLIDRIIYFIIIHAGTSTPFPAWGFTRWLLGMLEKLCRSGVGVGLSYWSAQRCGEVLLGWQFF